MKAIRRIALLLLVTATVAGGWWWLARPQPVAVLVHVVARGTVESTVANTRAGTVRAARRE